MPIPLWQILLKANSSPDKDALTCDECFILVEHLADQLVDDADWERLLHIAQEHLLRCPDCRERHLQRLHELVARRREHSARHPT